MQTDSTPESLPDLPALNGRVAILGGSAADKTAAGIGLALRQYQQGGTLLYIDARCRKQTAVLFRLLLRVPQRYFPLPASGVVSTAISKRALKTIHQSLRDGGPSPLLVCDEIPSHTEWEQSLSFFAKSGAVIAEILPSPAALVFGRYHTLILLPADKGVAEETSRAVGRKVEPQDLLGLPAGQGIFIHRLHVSRIKLPTLVHYEQG